MSQGTEHHLEEAEHARHAKHDPFDRRVALSMAIVAAALASVTLLSHRSHAEVQALKTEESDTWNYFQAKKARQYMYSADAEMLEALSGDAPTARRARRRRRWCRRGGATWRNTRRRRATRKRRRRTLQHKGQVAHDGSNFFDLGELGIELRAGPLLRGDAGQEPDAMDRGHRGRHAGFRRGDVRLFQRTNPERPPPDRNPSAVRRHDVLWRVPCFRGRSAACPAFRGA